MTTLGIFTVKRFRRHEGRYYTYGGFGEYLAEIRKFFDHVILVAHVHERPPAKGWYEVDPGETLEIVPLPGWPTEAGALLMLPLMYCVASSVIGRMDVVHARMPDYTGVIGAFIAQRHKIPCFHQIIADFATLAKSIPASKRFGLGLPLKLHLLFYDYFERRVSRGQLVFAQGIGCYQKHAPYSDCELVLSSAHRDEDIAPPAPKFNAPPYRILGVGRLIHMKNHAILIEVLERLNRHEKLWELTIIGEGSLRDMLLAKAAALGQSAHLRMPGQVPHGPPLWAEFDAADVFVLPSLGGEGTPKVVLEAMGRGLPVIASDTDGVPSAVRNEKTGLLVPPGDQGALIAALERMRQDVLLRDACQKAANLFAREQTVEATIRAMTERVFQRWPHLRPKEQLGRLERQGAI